MNDLVDEGRDEGSHSPQTGQSTVRACLLAYRRRVCGECELNYEDLSLCQLRSARLSSHDYKAFVDREHRREGLYHSPRTGQSTVRAEGRYHSPQTGKSTVRAEERYHSPQTGQSTVRAEGRYHSPQTGQSTVRAEGIYHSPQNGKSTVRAEGLYHSPQTGQSTVRACLSVGVRRRVCGEWDLNYKSRSCGILEVS